MIRMTIMLPTVHEKQHKLFICTTSGENRNAQKKTYL